MGGALGERAQGSGLAAGVVVRGDQLAGRGGAGETVGGGVERLAHRVDQGGGVAGGDQPAGGAVDDHLADGGDRGGHARDAGGHRLEQHGGQAVGVAVGPDHEGGDEQIRLREQAAHLLLRAGAQQVHVLGEPELLDAGGEVLAQGSVADDVGVHLAALGAQRVDGVDELVEALLLDQAPHTEQARHLADLGVAAEGEALELEPVAHQLEPGRGGGAEALDQVAAVVLADGDGVVGVAQLAGQVRILHVAVEDVLGVRGEGVGQVGHERGEARHGGGHRGEVGVEVGDAVLAGEHRHLERLLGIVHAGAHQLIELRGQAAGQARGGHRPAPHLPQAARARGAAHLDHGGLHPCQLRVEAGIDGRAQREDHDLLPRRLPGEDLRDDERLREAGVHLQHIADAVGTVSRHGVTPPGERGRTRERKRKQRAGAARRGGRRRPGRPGRCGCARCGR